MMDVAALEAAYARLKTGTLWSSTGRCKGFAVSNPGEASRIDAYVAALVSGQEAAVPTLATATGQGIVGLIEAGLDGAPPPDPAPAPTSAYLNDLGEFGRPARDWSVSTNWHPDSARLLGILKASTQSAVVALSSYGVAVARASSIDPVVAAANTNGWGNKPGGGSFRCPTQAKPATGSDGHLCVIQPDGSMWEMWKAARSSTGWTAGAVSMAAPGVYSYPLAGCRGSSFTLTSGLLTPEDVGMAPKHALLAILPSAAVRRAYMFPSTDTDGVQADGIPEGARLVLDPAASLLGLSGLTLTIARHLQTHGAIVGDKTGGTDLSFAAVAPETWTAFGQPDKWAAIGLSGYPNVSGLLALLPKMRIENQPIKVKE